MRQYIYRLITDEKKGIFASVVKTILFLFSLFYMLLLKLIRVMNRLIAVKLPCKVVSVGNLTLGGTGKTPMVCMLVESLVKEGHTPSVVIRGYGDDEWRMLEGKLRDIPVLVGRDKITSGKKACFKLMRDTILLDDGFQHWRLKRDLDIVLIDSTYPFGNRRLFPRGVLREEIKSLRRADIIVLTKTDMTKEKETMAIRDYLKSIVVDTPILEAVYSPVSVYDLFDRVPLPVDMLSGRRMCALSSIVNVKYFEYLLKTLGVHIDLGTYYPDHYNYNSKDLKHIFDKCKELSIREVITTEKDAVKLSRLKASYRKGQIYVLQIEMRITKGEDILKERLHNLYIT